MVYFSGHFGHHGFLYWWCLFILQDFPFILTCFLCHCRMASKLLWELSLSTSLASRLVSWYAHFNNLDATVSVFKSLKRPHLIAWNLIIKSHADLGFAKMIHCITVKMGFGFDLYFGDAMVEVYGKCERFGNAYKVFDEMLVRDLVNWTSVISGCFCERNVIGAFMLLSRTRMEMEPNLVTVIVCLHGCCKWGSLIGGR